MSMNEAERSSALSGDANRAGAGVTNEDSPVRVVVLASEPIVLEQIRTALTDRRIQLRVAENQTESMALLESWQPDVLVVNVDVDDHRTLEQLAGRQPIIAVARQKDVLSAFDRGAADVLIVPFASEEALARVLALQRRASQVTPRLLSVRSGELEIDILKRSARVGSAEIQLTPTELSLLYLLVANTGRALTRDQILNAVWGTERRVESNIVDQYVRNLRAKLRAVSVRGFSIATVPGLGYQFVADESVE